MEVLLSRDKSALYIQGETEFEREFLRNMFTLNDDRKVYFNPDTACVEVTVNEKGKKNMLHDNASLPVDDCIHCSQKIAITEENNTVDIYLLGKSPVLLDSIVPVIFVDGETSKVMTAAELLLCHKNIQKYIRSQPYYNSLKNVESKSKIVAVTGYKMAFVA